MEKYWRQVEEYYTLNRKLPGNDLVRLLCNIFVEYCTRNQLCLNGRLSKN